VQFDSDVKLIIQAVEGKSQKCSRSSVGLIYEKLIFKTRSVQLTIVKNGEKIGNYYGTEILELLDKHTSIFPCSKDNN